MGLRTTCFKQLDATAGALICRLAGRLEYRFGRADPRAVVPTDIRRILVIRPGGIGDMVNLLPVIESLQRLYPDASIDLVCETRNAEVLALAGLEDRALLYDTHPLRFLARLRRRRYDVAIDTEQFHHGSAVFAWLSGAPVRVGFKINPRRNALYTHLVSYSLDAHESGQFARLLEPLAAGRPVVVRPVPGFLAHTAQALPVGLRDKLGVEKGYAVVHVGSSTPGKQWPAARYAELASRLRDRDGLGLAAVGDRRDATRLPTVEGLVSLAGDLSLRDTAAAIQHARVFVGGDSGLAHLAAALGVPTVVLFGPSDPRKWGVSGPEHAVVRNELACAPCSIFGYLKPCRTVACMRSLTVDQVYDACRRVMDDAREAKAERPTPRPRPL